MSERRLDFFSDPFFSPPQINSDINAAEAFDRFVELLEFALFLVESLQQRS